MAEGGYSDDSDGMYLINGDILSNKVKLGFLRTLSGSCGDDADLAVG